jgi:Fe2+ or Zn2+ uptake regulation protein
MTTIINNSVKLTKNERTILTSIVIGKKLNDKYEVCIEKLADATDITFETILNTLMRLNKKNVVRVTNFDHSVNNGTGFVEIFGLTEIQ